VASNSNSSKVSPAFGGVRPLPSERSVFVPEGREAQLRQLKGHLRYTLAGQAQVVFVIGDAGTGKTALVDTFCRWAGEANDKLVVAWGQCSAQSGLGDPYLPFKEILALLVGDVEGTLAGRALTRSNASRLRQLLGHTGEAVVELGPDLVGTFLPGAGLVLRAGAYLAEKVGWLKPLEKLVKAPPSREGFKPEQLFEQFSRVVVRLTEQVPLVVVLEDLHWADAGTLDLLFYLTRRIREIGKLPLLIVGTYRLAELKLGRAGMRHPLQQVVNEIQRYWGEVEVDLTSALGGQCGRAFVNAFLDTQPNQLDKDFRESLLALTEGHPLFTLELLRALQARGVLALDEEGRWFLARPVVFEELPSRVDAVIEERVSRLDRGLRRILDCGSVEGEQFTAEVVGIVLGIEDLHLTECLDNELAQRHRLVSASGEVQINGRRLHLYKFCHALFQDYLYEGLSEMQREGLHGAVGQALEALYEGCADRIAGQLARHFDLAFEVDKAVTYYHMAAQRAQRAFANEDAVRLYSRALELSGKCGDLELHFELLSEQERVYDLLGRREAQRISLDQMLALAEKLKSISKTAMAYDRLAWYYERLGDYPAAALAAEQGLTVAQQGSDSRVEACNLIRLARVANWRGKYLAANDFANTALNIARQAGDQQAEASSLNTLGTISRNLGNYLAAQTCHKKELDIRRALSDRQGEALALYNLGDVQRELAKPEAALMSYKQARVIWHSVGDRQSEASSLTHLGNVHHGLANYATAQTCLEQALSILRSLGDRRREALSLTNLGVLYSELGGYQTAKAYLEEALAIRRTIDNPFGEANTRNVLGEVLCKLGDYAAARTCLEQALNQARLIGARALEADSLMYLGLTLEELSLQSEAKQAYSEALRLRRALGQDALAVDTLAGLARIALDQGDLSAAWTHAGRALAWIAEQGTSGVRFPLLVYHTYISVLQARGNPEKAMSVLQRAHALLVERVENIHDATLRKSFLENVQTNREIAKMWEALQETCS